MNEQIIQYKDFFDAKLNDFLARYKKNELYDVIVYALSGTGKRLRPFFMSLAYSLCGKDDEQYLPYAVALELIHNYSLIHDDLPCMDNDLIRHGKPSVFAKFGEAEALLAGDALLNTAYSIALEQIKQTPNEAALLASIELAKLSGIDGMIKGQAMEIKKMINDKEGFIKLYSLKCSCLFQAALTIGGILAGASQEIINALSDCGKYFGIAFQLTDDLLDTYGNPEVTGSGVKNNDNQEYSFVNVFGEETARKEMQYYYTLSLKSIENYFENNSLEKVIEYLVSRQY